MMKLSTICHALTEALLHSIWIGALLALLLAITFATILRKSAPKIRCHVAMGVLLTLAVTVGFLFRHLLNRDGTLPVTSGSTDLFLLDKHAQVISQYVVSLWGIGFAIVAARTLGGWWQLQRIRRMALPVADSTVRRHFDLVRARLGIQARVSLRVSDRIETPMMVGFLWPTVLIPLSLLQGAPIAYLQAVMAHELAHFRRWDYVLNLMQCVVEALFFFHPAVWWISRIIRDEREQACDDLAVSRAVELRDYAHALAWLEELRRGGTPFPAPAMSVRPGSTLGRIRRLVTEGTKIHSKPGSKCLERFSDSLLPGLSTGAATALITAAFVISGKASSHATEGVPASVVSEPTDSAESWFEKIRQDTDWIRQIRQYLEDSRTAWPVSSTPLFTSPVTLEKEGRIVRLDQEEPRLFEEFPNAYLTRHDLNLLDGDLPRRDPDGDGFSVLEEYLAETDPTSAESHPPFTNKLRFITRRARRYQVSFDATPDESHAQLTRHAIEKWDRRVFFVKEGETTPDGELRVDRLTKSEISLTHLPTNSQRVLAKREAITIPTWYAEMKLDLADQAPFFVKLGERFSLPIDPDSFFVLSEVSESGAVITPLIGETPSTAPLTIGSTP